MQCDLKVEFNLKRKTVQKKLLCRIFFFFLFTEKENIFQRKAPPGRLVNF